MLKNYTYVSLKSAFIVAAIIFILLSISCSKSQIISENPAVEEKHHSDKNEVQFIVLKKGSFKKELLSNGKITAPQQNILKFEISEKLQSIYVKNGDYVQKGQLLAVLYPFKYKQKLNKAEVEFKKARFQFEDMLVGRGIFTTNRDSIPKEIYDMVTSRSGYDAAKLELQTAQFEFNSIKLIAPFSGKVANIKSKMYESVNAGENFMTLINDSKFEVEFYLIESELNDIALNDKVQLYAFALDKNYTGRITSINPLIEENGTILIKAIVNNDGSLAEGMNVKVKIEKSIQQQLVVPKSAIILRDNQEVLFKVVSGKAYWTYVQTRLENTTSYSITADPNKNGSLKSGDTIIISNNLNLSHESEIILQKTNSNLSTL